jgi:asparagine synthase (glutamine-hydrolysing)
MGFSELGYSELPAAERVARHLGVSFQADNISPALADDLPKIASSAGEPLADTSLIPTYYLAQHTRHHVTVSLSGDGGDELFAGYDTYLADRLHRIVAPVLGPVSPAVVWAANSLLPLSHGKVSLDYKLRQFARGLRLPFEQAHWFWRNIFDEGGRRGVLRDGFDAAVVSDGFEHVARHFEAVRDCEPLDQAAYVDAKTWLADGVLVKVDRATMAHSLESRAPFLDHRLAEFGARLPARLKLNGRSKKYILRKAFASRLPNGSLDAPKQGFNAPVSSWILADLRDLVHDVLASKVITEVFKTGEVARLYQEHRARRVDNGQRLFNLLMFGLWRMSCPASI